jgi:hypothetical protein
MARRHDEPPEWGIPTSDHVDLMVARRLELFATPDEPARQKAVAGLLALRNPLLVDSVVRLLVDLLSHVDGLVQQAALASLREIGRPAVKPLASVLSDCLSAERGAAVLEALAALAVQD